MSSPLLSTRQLLASDISQYTKLGNAELMRGNPEQSLEAFQVAYNKALHLKEPYTTQSCAFNLGAVCIAAGIPYKGLELLQKAIPHETSTGLHQQSFDLGHLYYNFGLAYDMLKHHDAAIRYYDLALNEYKSGPDSFSTQAEAYAKLGGAYFRIGKPWNAQRCYGYAAICYDKSHMYDKQVLLLWYQAELLLKVDKILDCCRVLDRCLAVSESRLFDNTPTEATHSAKVISDIGLTYIKAKDFHKAIQCLEKALALITKADLGTNENLDSSIAVTNDPGQEAKIYQNLSVICHSQGNYIDTLKYLDKAIARHGDNGNISAQNQCYLNQGNTYIRMKKLQAACQSYKTCLSRSPDDKKLVWQANDGLAMIYMLQGDHSNAVVCLKLALRSLAESTANDVKTHERLVNRLTQALQGEMSEQFSVPSPEAAPSFQDPSDKNQMKLHVIYDEQGSQSNGNSDMISVMTSSQTTSSNTVTPVETTDKPPHLPGQTDNSSGSTSHVLVREFESATIDTCDPITPSENEVLTPRTRADVISSPYSRTNPSEPTLSGTQLLSVYTQQLSEDNEQMSSSESIVETGNIEHPERPAGREPSPPTIPPTLSTALVNEIEAKNEYRTYESPQALAHTYDSVAAGSQDGQTLDNTYSTIHPDSGTGLGDNTYATIPAAYSSEGVQSTLDNTYATISAVKTQRTGGTADITVVQTGNRDSMSSDENSEYSTDDDDEPAISDNKPVRIYEDLYQLRAKEQKKIAEPETQPSLSEHTGILANMTRAEREWTLFNIAKVRMEEEKARKVFKQKLSLRRQSEFQTTADVGVIPEVSVRQKAGKSSVCQIM